jgi:hypothetical protein
MDQALMLLPYSFTILRLFRSRSKNVTYHFQAGVKAVHEDLAYYGSDILEPRH